jgi:malonate-semialdehyde dehydrogenase (acetylating) / methylmalonate-semialdehyde dehydrogenase
LAVACGNAFVLKPSEKTPSAALLLAQLCAEAGLPPNVLQVIHGGTDTVRRLCRHPDVRSVSFVGGNAAGEAIYQDATAHGKRAQCNLGAKNHAVVLGDADVATTVRALVGAGFGAAGQRCMALSVVVLVGDATADAYVPLLVEQAQKLRVGVGWDPHADIGPLITAQSKGRVHRIIHQAVEEGATLHLDGRAHSQSIQLCDNLGGNFVGPTLLEVQDVNNAAYAEEIFGPVLVCVRVKTLEDAIQLVNANRYGNGVALFTRSGGAARQFVHRIDAGQVGINTPIPVPLPMFSFTGNKASIRGDVNFYGPSGVQFFTQLKTVTTNWPVPPTSSSLSGSAAAMELGGLNMPTMGGEGGGSAANPSSS